MPVYSIDNDGAQKKKSLYRPVVNRTREGKGIMGKFNELADHVIDYVGGKDNITYFTHCVTRLRFNVKDKEKVRKDDIAKLSGVIGALWSGEQFQIIIGQEVGDAYNLICEKTSLKEEKPVAAEAAEKTTEKKKFSLNMIFDAIAGCVSPCIAPLIGGGMLKVVLLLLTQLGWLSAEGGTYITLSFVSDAPFYFLPVMVGAFAAKKFGANMGIGMTLGAALISPTFVEMVANGSGGSVFGIPIAAQDYSSNVFAMILTMFVASYVEKFIAKHSPSFIRSITEPLLTLLVMIPVMFCALAPLGATIGNYLAGGLSWLYNTTGFFGLAVLTAVVPLFVLTGMHMAFPPIALQNFATFGYDPLICIASMISNFNQGAACLAVALKSKNAQVKGNASSSAVSAIVAGVSEPALFSTTLRFKTPLYGVMIGNFVGGAVAGIFKCCCYAFPGSFALFGFVATFGEKGISNTIYLAVAVIVGMIAAFAATMILYKAEEKGE